MKPNRRALYLVRAWRNLFAQRFFVPTIRALYLCLVLNLVGALSVGAQTQPRPTLPPEASASNHNRPIGLASIAHELAAELSGIHCRKVVVMDFWGSDASWSPSVLRGWRTSFLQLLGVLVTQSRWFSGHRAQLLISLRANGVLPRNRKER